MTAGQMSLVISLVSSVEYKQKTENITRKTDRRTQRTRELLQKALIELIREREYDDITIQDIVDRADIGRTTFYLHYKSKDELFMSCHESIIRDFHIGLHHPLSREEILSPEIPGQLTSAYRHLDEGRRLLYPIFQGKDSPLILRQIRERSAREIEANLRAIFDETECAIPLDLFATYLAGAQISLMQWWLEKHRAHTADDLTRTLYRMQRAAIRDAFGLHGQ